MVLPYSTFYSLKGYKEDTNCCLYFKKISLNYLCDKIYLALSRQNYNKCNNLNKTKHKLQTRCVDIILMGAFI